MCVCVCVFVCVCVCVVGTSESVILFSHVYIFNPQCMVNIITCTGPLLVQHCRIHAHYYSIGTLYGVFSGITLLPLQRQTIPKAVDALVDKELLEKSIQSIVDKQVSVLVRLSQSSIQHTIQ